MNTESCNRTETQLAACPSARPGPQLEFLLAEGARAQLLEPRSRRQNRARWWFQRMREVVELARGWQPVLVPRPEQIWFPNASREVSLAEQANAAQRQLCE